MSNRNIIWFRDSLVILFSLYVVFSFSTTPWANLKLSEPLPDDCITGCAPVVSFPDNNYYHYQNSITFEWNSVSVGYRVVVANDDTDEVVMDSNYTNVNTATTSRLPSGTYLVRVYYTGMSGSTFDTLPILKSELVDVVKDSGEKLIIAWSEVTVTYSIVVQNLHESDRLDETSYTYSDFTNGRSYSWSVYAQDSKGYISESSPVRDLNIDTTKFLAFELFNNWEVPFLLLGVMMVISLQAGVFLAKEEKDD
ncbi:MAG TPA: hypothetical protein QGI59_01515 [Candidatus Poseidoniia archaeon]|jgi:hypothetical protein|nr:hypothetical protein [Candidatus Poseidoniia archaeon]|tara:strand:- start:4138 stop:4893 length:756 start_codon:yes stop_codon:yes gene_type:complete